MNLLSRSEEIVLLSVWRLQDNAYGVTIRALVSEATQRSWSIGAIYAPLYRLERKGLVRSLPGEPTPERGGRRKIYYSGSDSKNCISGDSSVGFFILKPASDFLA